jgi:proteasome lid subunit RPN8/RPN11
MDRMREHLEAGYPNEACGALIGRVDATDHVVAEFRGMRNISHPDHPPVPSRFDADHAWTFYSYVVASVQKGTLREARSWRLDEAKAFQEEPLVVDEVAGPA